MPVAYRPAAGGKRRAGLPSLFFAALLATCLACSGPGDSSAVPDLLPIPEPDLSGAEQTVRGQIVDERASVLALSESGGSSPEELAQAMGDLGLLYFTYTFVDAAEVCFTNAVTLAPDDYRWSYLLGYLLKMEGRLPEAIAALEHARELAPDDLPSLLRLATAHLEQGERDTARRLFERALELEPDSAPALDGLGRVAAAAGDAAAAAGYFERVLELQPFATSVNHALGLAYRKLGRLEEAREQLERGGDAGVQIKDPLLVSLIELGKSAEIYLLRAGQAMDSERWDHAAALYPKALEIDPTDFMAHKALAFALEKLGDLDGALGQLHEALSVATTGDREQDRSEHAEIYRVMAGIEVVHGREAAAREHFQKSVELAPELLDSRVKLANALARSGRLEEALEHYDFVLERQPDNPAVLVKRATALINLRRFAEALAAFEQAVAASPDDPDVRLRYAEALDHLGEPAAAAAQRATARGTSVEDTERLALLVDEARRSTRGGSYEVAIERYREVLDTDPGHIDARYELATVLGHLGRFKESLEEFGAVVTSSPRHAPSRRGEVTALLLLGRYGAAREKLNQALAVLPRDRRLAHALARLLATAPDPRVRSGRLAVEIADKVFAARREPASAETRAMAYAEAGQVDQARALQRQWVAAAERAGAAAEATRLREISDLYQAGRAWRASSPDEILVILAGSGPAAG